MQTVFIVPIVPLKDSRKKKISSDIVYRYTCSNCKVIHYGKTYHHVFTRATEHMGISSLTGKLLKSGKQSAVSDLLTECNCSTEFDHFDILATGTNKFRLLIMESLLIKRYEPQLNKTIKSFPSCLIETFVDRIQQYSGMLLCKLWNWWRVYLNKNSISF